MKIGRNQIFLINQIYKYINLVLKPGLIFFIGGTNMSASNYEWMVIYGDYSTQVVTAYSIMDIIMSDNLEQSDSNIINIIRLDLY